MLVVIPQRGKYEILCVLMEVRLNQKAGVERPDVEIVWLGSQSLFKKFVGLVAVVQRGGKICQTNFCCSQVSTAQRIGEFPTYHRHILGDEQATSRMPPGRGRVLPDPRIP